MPTPNWKQTLIPIVLLSATYASMGQAATSTSAPPSPPPDDEVSHELLELRGTMATEGEQHALDNVSYFRPLCDADGYPLVGNMLPKDSDDMGPMQPVDPPYSPSEFCAHVRGDESQA